MRMMILKLATAFPVFTEQFTFDEGGATAIEYGLIAGLISVFIIAGVQMAGADLANKFSSIANNLN